MPLQALHPRWCDPLPLAIVDGGQVIAVSRLAASQGVRIGMRSTGAQAIAPDVRLLPREQQREVEAFDAAALALMQYTPEIATASEDALVLDVTASLSLFGGPRQVWRRVRSSVHALGFSPQLGMAPTAQGAWLLAQAADRQRRALSLTRLQHRLDALPFTLLPETAAHADWLAGIGCRTLADLRRLPRAGLKRRTRDRLPEVLDRAYGEAPELFDWLQAPERFSASVELPYRIEQAPMLLLAAQRLLTTMTGWLVARQQAVSGFMLWLEHERGRQRRAPTALDVVLSTPAWQEAHLLRLVRERLARLPLPAPVIGLRLEARALSAWSPPNGQLFPEPGGSPEDERRLLELLAARLGADAVRQPAPGADYRPEQANQWQAVGSASAASDADMPIAERPCWLLEQPLPLTMRGHRPFYGSPLRLLSGPERIEAGWWDGALALRDYFVAQGEEGARYWVYRERDAGSARWFLHGLFG